MTVIADSEKAALEAIGSESAPAPHRGIAGLFSDSFVYAAGTAVNQALRFLFLPIVLRTLAPAELGVFDSSRMLLLIAAPLVALGMESAVAILINERGGREQMARWMSTGLAAVCISAVFFGILGILFNRWLYQILLGGAGDIRVLWLVIVLTVLTPIAEYCRNLLKWQFRRAAYVVLLLGEALLTLGIGIILVSVLHLGVFGWVLAILIASVANLLGAIWANRRWWNKPQVRQYGVGMARLGFPFALVTASAQFTPFVTRLVMVQMVGLSIVGIFGVGERVALILGLALSGFSMAWGPYYLAKQHDADAGAAFGRAVGYYLIVATWLALAVVMFSDSLVRILTGSGYEDSVGVVLPLVMLTILAGMDFVAVGGIYIKKKGNYMIGVYLFTALAAVAFNVLLVPRFGAVGAAWGAFFAKLLGVCVSIAISQRLFPIQWHAARIARIMTVFIVAMVMARWLDAQPLTWSLLGASAILLLAFPLALLLLKAVDPADVALIKSRLADSRLRRAHAR